MASPQGIDQFLLRQPRAKIINNEATLVYDGILFTIIDDRGLQNYRAVGETVAFRP